MLIKELQKNIDEANYVAKKFLSNPNLSSKELQDILIARQADNELLISRNTYNNKMNELNKDRANQLNKLIAKLNQLKVKNHGQALSAVSILDQYRIMRSEIEMGIIRAKLNLISEYQGKYQEISCQYHYPEELDSINFRHFEEALKTEEQNLISCLSKYENSNFNMTEKNFMFENEQEFSSNLI